jgi:uncharacterized protein (DUF2252 family)
MRLATDTTGRQSTPDERSLAGKDVRRIRPRSQLGEWEPSHDRPDPIEVLQAQARTRVPDLVPIRYGRMAGSAFAFYRGAAALMAADHGALPTTGLDVQLCGDAHLANFGGFAAPDRQMVFDLNDFDETHRGPFEWDLQRLAASMEIAGRSLDVAPEPRRDAVLHLSSTYRRTMREFAALTELDVWQRRLDVDGIVSLAGDRVGPDFLGQMARTVKKAHKKDRYRALNRLTTQTDGRVRFVSDPPLLVPAVEIFDTVSADELARQIRELLESYRHTVARPFDTLLERYEFRDIARKVVGVGSVGTRAWVVLLTGRDDDDPLFLQVKEAEASVLEPYTTISRFESHGERVVRGQSLVQAATDPFLGWQQAVGVDGVTRDFYVRQLWDWKASADLTSMTAPVLSVYGELCAWALARAHARSGDRVALAAYLGRGPVFDESLASFAVSYADQNERDHAALVAAIRRGSIPANEEA